MSQTATKLMNLYNAMRDHFGEQAWWPADSPLEIMIGAVLTQNTNWKNVEKAIENLKRENLIDVEKLVSMDACELAELIRPAGYYNVKTKRLRNLMQFVWDNYDGDLDRLFDQHTESLREELLSVSGIGLETADDIILYAANKPTFVVDTYTYRIMQRHRVLCEDEDYASIKATFEDNLPADLKLFNEYHALIVLIGKYFCKKTAPKCEKCPLNRFEHDVNLPNADS